MSEVITRPAETKTRSTKAPAKAAPTAPDPIKVAFDIVQTLLDEASATDEPHAWSGDSNRLLRIAHNIADEASVRPPNASDAESVAFNIAALIRASKLVPGDTESEERRNLLDQAAVQLNWLTGCDTAGSNCIDPGAARPKAPNMAPSDSPSANERKVAATGVSLLGQAIKAINDEDGAAYAADLLKLGQKALQQASEGVVTEQCIRDVFFLAAAVCTGALAIEQRESPAAAHRHQLIMTAFEMLNNAGLSYDCELYPCAEAAAAIEAGARLATQPAQVARRTPAKNEPAPAAPKSTERARELTNSAICHLEAAREVLHMLAQDNAGDEVHGLVVLVDLLWDKHASTDEADDIGLPYDGVFADLQRELSVAQAMAALVRAKEEGAMSAVDYLLQDAAQLTEDALNAIPLEGSAP